MDNRNLREAGNGEKCEALGRAGTDPGQTARVTGKQALAQRINTIEMELHDLRTLHDSLPNLMPFGADDALRRIFGGW